MTTTSIGLLTQCVSLLKAAGTGAGQRVYSPGDWPTWDSQYPYIRARILSDSKESLGRSAARFTVTGTLRFTLTVGNFASPDDQGAGTAEQALWLLQRQVETALINNTAIMSQVQQVASMHSRDAYSADGAQHYGALELDVALEFYQDADDFWPIPTVGLTQINLDADLQNIFDPTGTYANPPFPTSVQPAPRTAGPDGRAEAVLIINFDDPDGGSSLDFSDPDNSGLLPGL